MFINFSTAVVLISALASPLVSAGPIEERGNSLCNKPNYGASGKPWDHDSSPGAWCGKNKPSNQGQWATLPYWDGGDKVRCNTWQKGQYKVCNGGNPKAPLPAKCNPPHSFPVGWSNGGSFQTKCVASTCSLWNIWGCFTKQTCTIVWVPNKGSTKPSSSAAAPSSTAPVSSAAASSAAASSAAASSAAAPSDAAPSDAAPSSAQVSPSATSAAPPATTTTVDPTQYPVCQNNYQVQYQNYTIVAPNGYWYGQTVGAALQDASYMTYTLANTVSDCLAACDNIEGCVFVNTYYDVNDTEEFLPKHTPGVLTCAMFSKCVGTEKNDNFGGQDDPNVIVQSNGYCKSGACS